MKGPARNTHGWRVYEYTEREWSIGMRAMNVDERMLVDTSTIVTIFLEVYYSLLDLALFE